MTSLVTVLITTYQDCIVKRYKLPKRQRQSLIAVFGISLTVVMFVNEAIINHALKIKTLGFEIIWTNFYNLVDFLKLASLNTMLHVFINQYNHA